MPIYHAKLEQHEWITTEVFEIEAETPEEAQKQAEAFVAEEKDISVEHRVSVEAIPVNESEETNNETEGEVEDGTEEPTES